MRNVAREGHDVRAAHGGTVPRPGAHNQQRKCRKCKDLQDGKLSRFNQKNGCEHQCEARSKHCQGCKVEAAKDEQSIPPTHCEGGKISNCQQQLLLEDAQAGYTGICKPHAGRWKNAGTAILSQSLQRSALRRCQVMSQIAILERPGYWVDYLRANQPSSSSLLVGAGRGAPGPSVVGSLT